jgi:outer membrane protein TolC
MNAPAGIIYHVPELAVTDAVVAAADSLSAGRSDLQAIQKGMEAYDYLLQSTRNSRLPRINGFASYQLNDKDPWGFGAGAYLAGVQVSWDIFRGHQDKRRIVTQKLEKQQLEQQLLQQVQQSNLEVRKTLRQISDIRYKINQVKASVEQVQEALRILNDRYTQGLVNTTDVVMTQTLLSQQQHGLMQAYMEKGMAEAYLKFLISSNK